MAHTSEHLPENVFRFPAGDKTLYDEIENEKHRYNCLTSAPMGPNSVI
jgi:hypothetical protein